MNEKLSNNDEELKLQVEFGFDEPNNLPLIDKKKPLISCTKMNKYFLFPFITAFFLAIRDIMMSNIIYYNDDINFHLVHLMNMDSFMFLGGLTCFLIDFRQYKELRLTKIMIKNNEKRRNSLNDLSNMEDKDISKIKLFLIFLIMSFSFTYYHFTVPYIANHMVLEKRQNTVFFIVLFNKLLLKKNIYKHQIFALIIIFLGFITLNTFLFFQIPSEDAWINGVSLIASVFYSIIYSLLEYLHKKYDIPIYFIYFMTSFFSLIISILSYISYSEIKYGDLSYFKDALYFFRHKIETKYYIMYIFFVLTGIATEIFIAYTIYYFSLNHFFTASYISPILLFIEKNINRDKDKNHIIIISIIVFIIEFIAILIYNEIIVLNICDLNAYTRKGINDREKLERELTEKTEKMMKEKNKTKKRLTLRGGYYIDVTDIVTDIDEDYIEEEENKDEGKSIEMSKELFSKF